MKIELTDDEVFEIFLCLSDLSAEFSRRIKQTESEEWRTHYEKRLEKVNKIINKIR